MSEHEFSKEHNWIDSLKRCEKHCGNRMKPYVHPILALTLCLAVALLAACKPAEKVPKAKAEPAPAEAALEASAQTNAPVITASPNPVPDGPTPGKTTISWDTGDGSWAEVYLAEPGNAEKPFAAGRKGSADAPWIASHGVYEFRLYAGTNHQRLLDSVKVTRP